jgi:hypothetical protein
LGNCFLICCGAGAGGDDVDDEQKRRTLLRIILHIPVRIRFVLKFTVWV